jgi:hypothetical protein
MIEAIADMVLLFGLIWGLRWIIIGLKEYWNE